MAISLIPNKKKKKITAGVLSETMAYVFDFLPALAVLGIVVVLYLSVSIWFADLKIQYNEIKEEKASLLDITNNSQTEDLNDFILRAGAIKTLVDEHITTSKVFRPFDNSIHKKIVLTSMNLNSPDRTLSVQGVAPDFESLGEQFIIWRDESIIFNDVVLDSFQREEEGNIIFEMFFEIKDDYIK